MGDDDQEIIVYDGGNLLFWDIFSLFPYKRKRKMSIQNPIDLSPGPASDENEEKKSTFIFPNKKV